MVNYQKTKTIAKKWKITCESRTLVTLIGLCIWGEKFVAYFPLLPWFYRDLRKLANLQFILQIKSTIQPEY